MAPSGLAFDWCHAKYERWLKQRGGLFLTNVTLGPIEHKEDEKKSNGNADWSPAGRLRD